MQIKGISYLELWQPLCLAEKKHLCNFCRGHHKEHFCEIILNLDQLFSKRYCLRYFLSRALVALLFSEAEPLVQF